MKSVYFAIDLVAKMWVQIAVFIFHLCFFTVTFIVPIFVAIALIPFYMYRVCVSYFVKRFHPTVVDLVSPLESTLAEDNITTCPKSAICGVIVLNGKPTLEDIRNVFQSKLVDIKCGFDNGSELSYPRFQQYPEKWFGLNFWKWDTEYSVKCHIREFQKCSTTCTEDEIIGEIGNLRMMPFRKSKPLWEILYVNNYEPQTYTNNNNMEDGSNDAETIENSGLKTALIFRVHHMMADGYSLLTAFMKDLCGENVDPMTPPISKKKRKEKVEKMWEMSNHVVRIPYLLLKQYLVDIDYHIWCTWESKLTHQMLSKWTNKIPTSVIKGISKRNDVTFTSVLLAAIAGGIHQYFVKNNMGQNIPKVMRAIAAAPVSGHPYDRLCNHWTFAVIPLPTGMSTPEGRLYTANATMLDLKETPMPLVNFYLMSVVGILPCWLIRIFSSAFFGTSVMSNFPGPSHQIKFGQQFPIEDMAFWPIFYRGRAGIGFTMLSYRDGIRISITIDKAHIATKKGVDELAQYIQEEFQIMNLPRHSALLNSDYTKQK